MWTLENFPVETVSARHGVEMQYVFGHPNPKAPWSDADRQLSQALAAYWTNFAKTGNPNGARLPVWPAFTQAREHALLIGREIRAASLPNAADLAAIDRLYATVRFVLNNFYLVIGGTVILLLVSLAILWGIIRRAFRRRAA